MRILIELDETMPETLPRAQEPMRWVMHGRMTPCFRVERINRGQADPQEPKACTVAGSMTRYGQEKWPAVRPPNDRS